MEIYTPKEAGDFLKLNTETIYDYIKSGHIRASKIGNRYRITGEALEEFLRNMEVE